MRTKYLPGQLVNVTHHGSIATGEVKSTVCGRIIIELLLGTMSGFFVTRTELDVTPVKLLSQA